MARLKEVPGLEERLRAQQRFDHDDQAEAFSTPSDRGHHPGTPLSDVRGVTTRRPGTAPGCVRRRHTSIQNTTFYFVDT